ncbi:MAG: hypothetical protein JNG88_11720 [Phycisphaerales bacterium]|nr:hypothetical protein [Phycisphaerales bacterium]
MFFVGTHELVIDAKNRMSIPVDLRATVNADTEGRSFFVRPGRCRGTLELWPEKVFQRKWSEDPSSDYLSDEAFAWRQYELANTALVDPDNQGRVLIPEMLLECVGLGKEVALIGVYDHMELWNRQALAEYLAKHGSNYEQNRARSVRESQKFRQSNPAAAPIEPVSKQ